MSSSPRPPVVLGPLRDACYPHHVSRRNLGRRTELIILLAILCACGAPAEENFSVETVLEPLEPESGSTALAEGETSTVGSATTSGAGTSSDVFDSANGIDTPDSGTGVDMLDPDEACAIGTAEAVLEKIAVLVMFDRSTSMVDETTIDPTTQRTRWDTAALALKDFVRAPEAAGLAIALRFFPHDEPIVGCTGEDDTCDATACADPLVEIGTLTIEMAPTDQHEEALLSVIDAAMPTDDDRGQGTPTGVALQGATRWAADYQARHPEERAVILLITDGWPSVCERTVDFLFGNLTDAYREEGVRTFVVGLQDSEGTALSELNMNRLADAGGTNQAYFIRDGEMAGKHLVDTINSIRGRALACDFPLPEVTSEGLVINPDLVNVTYASGEDFETTFTKVGDSIDCGDSSSWYYDDETKPTRVHLCPSACDTVSSDSSARFEILVGCTPIVG